MRYCIIPANELNNINFSTVVENKDTVRYNLTENEFIVKYMNIKPECLESYTDYMHSEILTIINNPSNGWITNED